MTMMIIRLIIKLRVSSSITLFLLLLLLLLLLDATSSTIVIHNNCPYTVWAAAVPGGGRRLDSGQNWILNVSTSTNGLLWARTGCSFNASGQGRCQTGDCGGQLECDVPGAAPNTLAEYGLGQLSQDYFYISVMDGFNVPLEFSPTTPNHNCSTYGVGLRCDADINGQCPSELRAPGGSPCTVFNTEEYCCSNATTTNCGPTTYSMFFKRRCPDAYTYPREDPISNFSCASGISNTYRLRFCPSQPLLTRPAMPPTQISPSYPPESESGRGGGGGGLLGGGGGGSSKVDIGRLVGIIMGAVTVVSVLIIVTIICCIRRRRLRGHHNLNVETFLLQHGSLALKRYKYSEIKKMTKSLSEKLGQGGYGSVYKGKLPDGFLVAVKVLTDTNSNGEEFINEVASISRTSHVNIVNLLGFCFDTQNSTLVYEYMPNKSLDKYIADGSLDRLDIETLYKIALGVAKGLEYLHTGCNTRIVHFDIKPQNILLDQDFCPKISDFGLAKLCKKKQSLVSVLGTRGTPGYIAPEVFSRNFGGVSHKSDVYSYGMMVLEMAGANALIVGQSDNTQSSENYFPDGIYERVIDDVTRMSADGITITTHEDVTSRKMLLVGFWCIQTNPSDRPPISMVVEMLEGSFQSIQIPPKPVLFTPALPVLQGSSSFSSYVETTEHSSQAAVQA
ncbi:PR5-like receptor kinase [Striga hermonthica]|uniref:PR5-like receptor kinase n=1 Tax=Striga hermonthica TaxID=68872 RepID=A0A9N7R2D9_STRHE|nr:PR5-like receptor kinase [Striga hermonthica]